MTYACTQEGAEVIALVNILSSLVKFQLNLCKLAKSWQPVSYQLHTMAIVTLLEQTITKKQVSKNERQWSATKSISIPYVLRVN